MRIRTGMKQLTADFSKKGFIEYKCPKCGSKEVFVYNIVSQQTEFYHALGGETAERNAKNQAAVHAMEEMEKSDAELFKSVNIDRDYQKVAQKVVCPKCGEKQVWSGIPCEWKKVKLFRLWLVAVIFFMLDTALTLLFAINNTDALFLPFIMACYAIILLLLPIIRKNRRKKAIKRIGNTDFEPPIYYNKSNLPKSE